ncbi:MULTISPECIES: hypothetical protein [Paracoccaceae]|uniref:hypothetical protein n=1 Tax=Paracoccaceae TaxID=31989 RepID=UPI003297C96C
MKIPNSHPTLHVDGNAYDLSHLSAFAVPVAGKGREEGTDLNVLVKFSNHVFTERTMHGQRHDTVDHRGTRRSFDADRYQMSLRLPDLIANAFFDGSYCFVSKDFSGFENLMLVQMENGDTWSVVFCFEPLADAVVLEVLSTHPKPIRDHHASRRPLVFYARKCLFGQHRIPKN